MNFGKTYIPRTIIYLKKNSHIVQVIILGIPNDRLLPVVFQTITAADVYFNGSAETTDLYFNGATGSTAYAYGV